MFYAITGELNTKSEVLSSSQISLDPLFHAQILVPTGNPVRMQYAHRVARELESVGISCDVNIASWRTVEPRLWTQETGQWTDNGYDIVFVGYAWGWHGDHRGKGLQQYFRGIPPFPGLNIMYWSSKSTDYLTYGASESESFIQQINTKLDLNDYKECMYEWQKLWYDVLPNVLIYTPYTNLYPVSTGLYGFDPALYASPIAWSTISSSSWLENLWTDSSYTGSEDHVVFATSLPFEDFNTLLEDYNRVFMDSVAAPVMDVLVGKTPSKQLLLPPGIDRDSWMLSNYDTTESFKLYPRVANSLGSYSGDGLQYRITTRDDVYWHDGQRLDAWDVAFSYQALLLPDIPHSFSKDVRAIFGADDKVNQSGLYAFVVEDTDADGFYESLTFHLTNQAVDFETSYLGFHLFPEHILGDPSNHGFNTSDYLDPNNTWLVPPSEWVHHSFNTGNPNDPGGLNGPIGCGSMIFKEYSSSTGRISMEKFANIQWDHISRKWVANDSNDHYFIKDGKLNKILHTVEINEMPLDDAIEELKAGNVNILDYENYLLAPKYSELKTESTIQIGYDPGSTWQALFVNPKFTTTTQLGVNDRPFNRKGVRHAISHVIPRLEIINKLENGLGTVVHTPIPLNSWAVLPADEMLSNKQMIMASDSSYLEADATTAWDTYDRQLALDWLESEGYDVTVWRNWEPRAPPEWVTGEPQQWYSKIKKGIILNFKITSVKDIDGTDSWFWEAANVTLHEDDIIRITWNSNPVTDESVGLAGPISYPISVSIGGKTLDAAHAQQFGWFILPLVTTDGFGDRESGIRAAERFFYNNFYLVNGPRVRDRGPTSSKDEWNLFVHGDPTLYETGQSAIPGKNEIHASIVTHDDTWESILAIEDHVFNLTYNANSGILKKLIFTNTEGHDPSSGTINSFIVQGLKKLEITGPNTTPPQTTTPSTTITSTSSSANWSILIILATISIVTLRKRFKT